MCGKENGDEWQRGLAQNQFAVVVYLCHGALAVEVVNLWSGASYGLAEKATISLSGGIDLLIGAAVDASDIEVDGERL